jgi:hypothetical protein
MLARVPIVLLLGVLTVVEGDKAAGVAIDGDETYMGNLREDAVLTDGEHDESVDRKALGFAQDETDEGDSLAKVGTVLTTCNHKLAIDPINRISPDYRRCESISTSWMKTTMEKSQNPSSRTGSGKC